MKPSRPVWIALAVMLLIVLVWSAAYPLARFLPQGTFQDPLEKVYNGLNVLFTALAFGGVIVTLMFQADESRIARREEVERSIFEMFQIFTSPDFQDVKTSAFRTLIASVIDRDYAEFLANKLFVAKIVTFPVSSLATVRGLDKAKQTMEIEQVMDADRSDRLKLDNILNFFAMLAQRESASAVIKHCDFAYDWWRPMLYMVGQLQKEIYDASSTEDRDYCRAPLIMATLRKLDAVYGHAAFSSDAKVWAYLNKHPKIREFRSWQSTPAASTAIAEEAVH